LCYLKTVNGFVFSEFGGIGGMGQMKVLFSLLLFGEIWHSLP